MTDIVNVIQTTFVTVVSGITYILTIVTKIPSYVAYSAEFINSAFPDYLKYPLFFMVIIAVMINIKRLVHE